MNYQKIDFWPKSYQKYILAMIRVEIGQGNLEKPGKWLWHWKSQGAFKKSLEKSGKVRENHLIRENSSIYSKFHTQYVTYSAHTYPMCPVLEIYRHLRTRFFLSGQNENAWNLVFSLFCSIFIYFSWNFLCELQISLRTYVFSFISIGQCHEQIWSKDRFCS